MERRKITMLGKYSYIITLPKEWINMHDISRGDSVSVRIEGNGALTVTPQLNSIEKSLEKTIPIGVNEDPNTIVRNVIGCYLNGINIIHIVSAKNFTPEQQNAIRNVVRSLYMRILESTSSKVTLQTFMDESLASVESGIERMHIITSSMFKDVITALREWDENLAKSVLTLEEDVDQFMFFLMRLLRISISHPSLASKLNLTMTDCFDYHLLINRIEYIADHLEEISMVVINLKNVSAQIPETIMTYLIKFAEETCRHYEIAVDSFFTGSLDQVNEIIDAKDTQGSIEEAFKPFQLLNDQDKTTIWQLYSINDNLSRIRKFTADIAEITIDRSLG